MKLRIVPTAIIAAVAAVVLLVVSNLIAKNSEFVAGCEAAGGIPFQPRDSWICLNQSAVITLK